MTFTESEERLLEHWRTLPSDKRQEVIDFLEFLRQKSRLAPPVKSSRGLWANLNIPLTKET
jgi:hypothetical protein